jgi:adsorption protein B
MLRDRKSTVTAIGNVLAYGLVLQFIFIQLGMMTGWWSSFYPSLFADNSWWRTLIYVNGVFLLVRCAQRVYFTTRLYGWEHGVLSVPRMVVSNLINFMAVARAWRLYLSYLFRGKALVWDKTMHDFPTAAQLTRRRQRLGDLLQSWQAVDEGTLNKALEEQTVTRIPLGRILVSNGWLDEETLAEAMAYQADLPRAHLTAEIVRRHAAQVPLDFGTRYRAVSLGIDAANRPLLAVASPLAPESLAEIEQILGTPPRQRIVRESEVTLALRLLRGGDGSFAELKDGGGAAVPLLGDALIEQGLVQRDVFVVAMQAYRPEQHGRVGDYLVEQGVIPREVSDRVVNQQREMQAERSKARALAS